MRWRGAVAALLWVSLLVAACTDEGQETAGGGAPTPAAAPGLPAVTFATATGATVPLFVEVADEAEEKQCGLMHRTSLPEGQGMIFVYSEDNAGGFWMRNTLIPLSIAYVAADGRIIDVLDMEPVPAPGHTPYRLADGRTVAIADGQAVPAGAAWVTYPPRAPYRYAIEVNQGWFARHGVAAGDRVEAAAAIGGGAGAPPPLCRERGT